MVLGWIAAGAAALGATGAGLAGYAHRTRRTVERDLPPEGRMVEAAGHRLHVVERGESGPPVLLIHGLGGTTRHWHAMIPDLARDHRVVAVDRPGSGYSSRARRAGGGPIEQAEAIAALIDALELDRPLVVGHSLGGAVALAAGLHHPEKVSGLALICPATQPVHEAPELFEPLVIHSDLARRLIAWTLAVPLSRRNGPEGLRVAFSPEPVPDDFRTAAGGLLSLRPEAFRNASLDLTVLPHDLQEMASRYRDLAVPAAILFAADDAVVDPVLHGERTAAENGIPLTVREGGHMLPMTQGPIVCDWVRGLEREWAVAETVAAE